MAGERRATASGAIVWRRDQSGRGPGAIELALIHRPRYDDWTFPKGKVDPGEVLPQTAVREVREETGLKVRLGHPLPVVRYRVSGGIKTVHYWSARSLSPDVPKFRPNREVDELRWVRPRDAARLLSYAHDQTLLDDFRELRERKGHKTRTLIVLRHAKAKSRNTFRGDDDLERPLIQVGAHRARLTVPLLAAYGVRRIITSPAVRCATTVEPYAKSISTFVEVDDRLTEDTSPGRVARSVQAMLEHKPPTVLCTHRPTLPWVFEALGMEPVDLMTGHGVVVHHRKGEVLASEPF